MEEYNRDIYNRDMVDDTLLISQTSLKLVKQQRIMYEKFCAEVADMMDKLKTEKGREDLAKLTQSNYAQMINMDIKITELEGAIKLLKLSAGMFLD